MLPETKVTISSAFLLPMINQCYNINNQIYVLINTADINAANQYKSK